MYLTEEGARNTLRDYVGDTSVTFDVVPDSSDARTYAARSSDGGEYIVTQDADEPIVVEVRFTQWPPCSKGWALK